MGRFTRTAFFVESTQFARSTGCKCQLRGAEPNPLTLAAPAVTLASIFLTLRNSPLKVYRPTRQLLADVDRLLAASRPSAHHSPLEDVIDLLCRGRHYAWVGIFLAVGEGAPQQTLGQAETSQVKWRCRKPVPRFSSP